jgi:LuxR family transcriptional regulator, maltose regulon positive regulatory protein
VVGADSVGTRAWLVLWSGSEDQDPLILQAKEANASMLRPIRFLAEFCSNEEIAADLVSSRNTVKTHMRSLFQKLSVTRRADAVRRGRALGLC